MTGTSNIGSSLNTQYLLKVLRGKLDDTQAMASSGKKSNSTAGMGTLGASNAITSRNTVNLLQSYTDNLNAAAGRLKIMDASMGAITDNANTVLSTLRSQLQSATPKASIVSAEAKAVMADTMQKLNAQVNGRYVFGGDDYQTAPYADAASLQSATGPLVTGWLGGTPTVGSIMADARGLTDTQLGFSAGLATAGKISFRGGDDADIDMTLLADKPGFKDILRGMSIVSNLPQPTTQAQQDNYWTAVNAAIKLIDEGMRATEETRGVMGTTANQVQDLLVQHSETTATLQIFIGSVEDADMTQVSTDLQLLQTQLQASYSVLANLKDLSLVNYIR